MTVAFLVFCLFLCRSSSWHNGMKRVEESLVTNESVDLSIFLPFQQKQWHVRDNNMSNLFLREYGHEFLTHRSCCDVNLVWFCCREEKICLDSQLVSFFLFTFISQLMMSCCSDQEELLHSLLDHWVRKGNQNQKRGIILNVTFRFTPLCEVV